LSHTGVQVRPHPTHLSRLNTVLQGKVRAT